MKQSLQAARTVVPEQPQPQNTIGIDLGDRWSRYCIVEANGSVVEEDRLRTTVEAMKAKFGAMPPRN